MTEAHEPASSPVVVTGASRGIGLAIARRLAADGYPVLVVSRSLPEPLEELIAAPRGRVRHLAADLADTAAIPALARSIHAELPDLYGLVNNAGVGLGGVLATQHAADIERMLATNLTSPILLAKHLSRGMIRNCRGRIVNITSIVARTGFTGLAAYAATKAGLEGFTRSLARELGRVSVTVNAVAPGFTETEMTSTLGPDQLATIRRRSPLGLADPADVAGAVAYLLGPDAARITGTTVTVDGGSTA